MQHDMIFIAYRDDYQNRYNGRHQAHKIIRELKQYKVIEKDDADRIGYVLLEKK